MGQMDKINNEINDLIISFLSGNSRVEENTVLLDWINQSDENKSYFIKLQNTWLAAGQVSDVNVVNTEKALLKFNQSVEQNPKESTKKFLNLFIRISRIAAAFLLVFLLGGIGSYFIFGHTSDVASVSSVHAPKGSKAMTVLPDGSEVWLNAGSSLSFNNTAYFKKNREVRLRGEAYFKVITNKNKPFVVKAKGLDIKALGTEFNVKAYPEEKIVETTLVEGIVKIEGKDQNKETVDIMLVPRQKLVCYIGKELVGSPKELDQKISDFKSNDNLQTGDLSAEKLSNPIIYNNVKTDLYTSWKDNRWIIDGLDIGQLAVMMERKYNVSIEFESEELKNYKFTGTFQNETLEQVMLVLKLTAPLNYEIGKGKVELSLDPLLKDTYEKFLNSNSVKSD